jgi:hypothetical protein
VTFQNTLRRNSLPAKRDAGPCDPQKWHFQSESGLAGLLTLADDVKALHAVAREFAKLFKDRMQNLGTYGSEALLNTTPIHSP